MKFGIRDLSRWCWCKAFSLAEKNHLKVLPVQYIGFTPTTNNKRKVHATYDVFDVMIRAPAPYLFVH